MGTDRDRAATSARSADDGAPVDDVSRRPWTYPGVPAPHPGRLDDGRLHELSEGDLRRLAAERSASTTLVVAVGCNASPWVLSRKLRERGISDDVVVLTAVLSGFGIGHSAHVSAPGYIAATPYADPAAECRVVALLLDADQRRALDETEPNYHRRTIVGTPALTLSTGDRADRFVLYDSVWGVLAAPGRRPVPLMRQHEIHRHLRTHCPAYADTVPASDDLAETMARLHADADLRRRVREALRDTGWTRPSGLDPTTVRSW